MKRRSEAENLLLMHKNVITTLSRQVCSAKYIVCVLFCWCKIKSTFIHGFCLDNTKSGKQTGKFKHKDEIGQQETIKTTNTIDGRPPRNKGYVSTKGPWHAFLERQQFFFTGRLENMLLCFIVYYGLIIDLYKDKHLKINYLKFDKKKNNNNKKKKKYL